MVINGSSLSCHPTSPFKSHHFKISVAAFILLPDCSISIMYMQACSSGRLLIFPDHFNRLSVTLPGISGCSLYTLYVCVFDPVVSCEPAHPTLFYPHLRT